jgi:Rod binding domain-containing protein
VKVQDDFALNTRETLPPATSSGKGNAKLLKTCQDFESVFLTMIWKEMQKSSGVDLGVFGAFAEGAMGQSWAKSGGIGLAKVIFNSMSKHLSD